MTHSTEFSTFAQTVVDQKYAQTLPDGTKESWPQIAYRVAYNVLNPMGVPMETILEVAALIESRKFIPGGRYLYAAGRPFHQVNNCVLNRCEDSREGWADHLHKASMALMTGAGLGVVYSDVRPKGSPIKKTGGTATGPLALMQMTNEVGRGVQQGGSRRCLPAGTKITMADHSLKNIEDVQIGDLVATRKGPHTVSNVFDQGLQDIVEIVTDNGTVRSSLNHKWLTSTRSRTKTFYVPADALNLGCKLYKIFPVRHGGANFDTNLAYTVGYYLGDGCAYHCGRSHEVTFQLAGRKYNAEQAKRIMTTLSSLGFGEGTTRNGHEDCTEIRCQRIDAANYFQQFKVPNTAFVIPTIIKEASLEARRAFMAGWFDADGYLGSDAWKLANTHPSTRKEIMEFLSDLGFKVTEDGMEIRISSYQKQHYTDTIGKYTFKRSRFGTHKDTPEVPSDILSLRKIGFEHTFDIEVEEVHEFIADNFVSHNSALWAGLHWSHADIFEFVHCKEWTSEIRAMKAKDFNAFAPMDGTNISVILDDDFFAAYHTRQNPLHEHACLVYQATVESMLRTGEPGFSVDCGKNQGENNRNACCELTSYDDSDICNLGSINMARISSLDEMDRVVRLGTLFLLAGTVYSDVPYQKISDVRDKNRRLGLGLMGLHEWLLLRGYKYEGNPELAEYMEVYKRSDKYAKQYAWAWKISCPIKTRAVAPTGTIGIVGETTTGIEPIFCVCYKRRYLDGLTWKYQYVVDPTAKRLIDSGVKPEDIEDAYTLARDPEKRIAFQAWLQQYVDHGISSTLNIPQWNSEFNTAERVAGFGEMLMQYLPRLRGITVYPDGARGGQPLTPVAYKTALKHEGQIFLEAADICDLTKGGTCGS